MVTREEVIFRINACREQVDRVLRIAPDTIPMFIRRIVAGDDSGTTLDKVLEGKDDETKTAFYGLIDTGLNSIIEQLGTFEADLRSRMQPEGEPRIKREFKQFKHRKGEW